MRNTRIRGLAALPLAAILVFATGCSSSKSSTAPNTPEQRKVDKALGQKAVLKLADLPTGYKESPHVDDPADDTPEPVLRKFASCAKIPKAKIAALLDNKADPKEVEVKASDFARRDATTGYSTSFENTVDLERSSKDVTQPFDVFMAKKVLPCWKDLFQAVFAGGASETTSIRDVAVESISTGKIADKSAGLGVRVTIVGATRSVNAYVDVYLVCSGRAGISLVATGIGARADTSLSVSLLRKVASRLEGTT